MNGSVKEYHSFGQEEQNNSFCFYDEGGVCWFCSNGVADKASGKTYLSERPTCLKEI